MINILNSLVGFLNTIKVYAPSLSFIVASLALVVTITNNCGNKKRIKEEKCLAEKRYNEQKEQYEARLTEERIRREEDKKIADECARISEQPYLVFKKAERLKVIPSSTETQIVFFMSFLNKGRGSAYNIVPDLNCTASYMGDKFTVSRYGAVEDPIAMVNENFVMEWSYIGKEIYGYRMPFSINYEDASGRRYVQKYEVDIISEKEANIINYAKPELSEA